MRHPMRLEMRFQIDEGNLDTAITDICQFAQLDPLGVFGEVALLLAKLKDARNRYPVDPGNEDYTGERDDG